MTGLTSNGIEIDLEVSAPPQDVFRAWVETESFAKWFGGAHVEVPLETLDYQPEPGRTWQAQMVLPDGNTINWTGRFVEVEEPSRFTFTITDVPEDPTQALVTVDLTELDSGTAMHMTQETPGFSDEQKLATIEGFKGFLEVLKDEAEG